MAVLKVGGEAAEALSGAGRLTANEGGEIAENSPRAGVDDVATGVEGAAVAGNAAKAGEYTVYGLFDPVTGEVKYVGRTINPRAREAAHAASTDKAGLMFTPLKEGLTYPEARGWEQKLFDQNGG